MKKIDRMRERVTILPTSTYLSKMHDAGWTLIALEWEREVETSSAPEPEQLPAASEEIPFGLRIGADCRHLEDDPLEMQTLRFLAEMIVQDISFTSMADALNVREYRTRDGRPWNAAGVFKLTPRLIDVAPRLLSGAEWESRKKQLSRVHHGESPIHHQPQVADHQHDGNDRRNHECRMNRHMIRQVRQQQMKGEERGCQEKIVHRVQIVAAQRGQNEHQK